MMLGRVLPVPAPDAMHLEESLDPPCAAQHVAHDPCPALPSPSPASNNRRPPGFLQARLRLRRRSPLHNTRWYPVSLLYTEDLGQPWQSEAKKHTI
jgi:hypothetical protein